MQTTLFGDEPPHLPPGFEYRPDFLSADEERALLEAIAGVEFSSVEMRGGVAKRRTAHYGVTYGYDARTAEPGAAIPGFLLPLRERAGEWAGIDGDMLVEALITEYPEGAPIGWHRDAPMFGDVIGVSLAGACRMKFRPYLSPKDVRAGQPPRRTTHELTLEPRSAYIIRGASRRDYEHSIPPVDTPRYSLTFRTLRQRLA